MPWSDLTPPSVPRLRSPTSFPTNFCPRRVDSLSISVLADGNPVTTLNYNAESGRYESDFRPQPGSVVTLRTTYKGHTVEGTDTVPRPVTIENISVERTGRYTYITKTTGY